MRNKNVCDSLIFFYIRLISVYHREEKDGVVDIKIRLLRAMTNT